MSTRPLEPDSPVPGMEEAEPNTSQLPIEPEFEIKLPPAEPEKTGTQPHAS